MCLDNAHGTALTVSGHHPMGGAWRRGKKAKTRLPGRLVPRSRGTGLRSLRTKKEVEDEGEAGDVEEEEERAAGGGGRRCLCS